MDVIPLPTVAAALRHATDAFTQAAIDTPRLDAQLLVAHALRVRRESLVAYPDRALSDDDRNEIARLVALRAQRHPLAYLTGTQWFYGREFDVTPEVLIPRPETEMLVAFALDRASQSGTVADIGTGSGCIAVSIAAERRDLHVTASDLSPQALSVAARNVARHTVAGRVALVAGDLLAPLSERFDVIVSNPPYIPRSDMDDLMPEVRDFEPRLALCEGAGHDGLAIYRRLWADAHAYLRPNGWLAVEVGQGQAQAVASFAEAAGFCSITVQADGAGTDRVVSGQAHSVG
jgi:release factor glutamine methyltransferase